MNQYFYTAKVFLGNGETIMLSGPAHLYDQDKIQKTGHGLNHNVGTTYNLSGIISPNGSTVSMANVIYSIREDNPELFENRNEEDIKVLTLNKL